MMRNHRLWLRWLCCVPVSFGFVQLGRQRPVKQPIVDGAFQLALPARLAELD
jgi:hypothetical protein